MKRLILTAAAFVLALFTAVICFESEIPSVVIFCLLALWLLCQIFTPEGGAA